MTPVTAAAEAQAVAAARPSRPRVEWILTALTLASILLAWYAIARYRLVSDLFVPHPAAVWEAFVDVLTEGYRGETLARHLADSLYRVVAGFALAVVTAVPLGLAIGYSPRIRAVFDPLIEFYRPLPPLSYLPLVIIWFGIDELPKVILIYLACFAPLALAARSGMRAATQEQVHAAYSMGATHWQVVRHVILPAALPEILVGMRIAIGFGWTTLVAAEMVAANVGLGQMVLNASNFLRTDIVVMGIIVIGVVAYAFDLLMRWLERRLVPWKGRA